MIRGIGVDSIELSRMTPRLAQKILTPKEYVIYEQKQGVNQTQFLAGRFAVKEAYAKARGTGIGVVKFHDLSILNDEAGAPYIELTKPSSDVIHVSITHDTLHATAFVIIETTLKGGE